MHLLKSLHACLISKQYLATVYEKLAENTHDECMQQLFRKYAEDENCHFASIRSFYEETSGQPYVPPSTPEVPIHDFRTVLLECVSREITDIDNYKSLWQKMQAPDLRNVFYQQLQCDIRHGYGLLVLITPDDTPVK